MKLSFENSTLIVSSRSPYARRVRLALLEHAIPYEEKVIDVWKLQPELLAVNPLNRVPTIVLESGEVLVESQLILSAFYDSIGKSPWMPSDESARAQAYFWSAMAIGLIDKTIEHFLETLRPAERRDPEVFEEAKGLIDRTLARLESHLEGHRTVLSAGLSQADLDLGTALAYLSFRYGREWEGRFPRAAAYLAELDRRPFFARTRPVG